MNCRAIMPLLLSKKNLYLMAGLAGLLILFIILFFGLREQAPREVDLEFWSVYDDSDVYRDLIEEFRQKYPFIKIKYTKKSFESYENDLINALAANRGPDIFSIQNNWLPKHQDKISPLPNDLMLLKDYQSAFVDVAKEDLVVNGRIYGLPLFVDTLALYYNKDLFNSVGIPEPPKTWDEFIGDVIKLAVKDESGNILRAGASIGAARNINRSTDILSLLMLQNGTQMVDEQKSQANFDAPISVNRQLYNAGEEALRFYTDFANPTTAVYTWSPYLDYSIDMFYAGRSAMMFNYAYHYPTIKAKSPYLNFAVAPMPQISGAEKYVNYANYWAQSVSIKSKNVKYAWRFLLWLAEKNQAQKYAELTGRPVSRRDLIPWQRVNPETGIFADQALTARSWYQADASAIESIFADMIELTVAGKSSLEDALNKASRQVTVLMRKP